MIIIVMEDGNNTNGIHGDYIYIKYEQGDRYVQVLTVPTGDLQA